MTTQFIKLEDDILVQIEESSDRVEQISGRFANKVDATIEEIQPILLKICRPINSAWNELNKEMHIEQAEVELGLSFEGEGNIYVTKTKAGANLVVKLVLKPKNDIKR